MKVLTIPDVHGRQFWKEPCKDIGEYDKVIFLGDYLDPYGFENISVEDAIANFGEILEFADKHRGKADLLLGNHKIILLILEIFYGNHIFTYIRL